MHKAVVVLLSLCICTALWTQEKSSSVPEPEFFSTFYYVSSTGSLLQLERQKVELLVKTKAWGFAGGSVAYSIQGEKSPVRLKSPMEESVVVKLPAGIDPQSVVQFLHFQPKKGSRVIVFTKVGSMGTGDTKSTLSSSEVPFNASRHGESSFKIVPASPLAPGEYCLSTTDSNQAFCFGIDEQIR